MSDQFRVDHAGQGAPTSIAVTLSTSSQDVAIPANTELLGLAASGVCHFRTGLGAQTAVGTDPLLTPGMGLLRLRLDPNIDTHIAFIQTVTDAAAPAGQAVAFKLYED